MAFYFSFAFILAIILLFLTSKQGVYTVLTQLISQYLETNRRLNIPAVGAFIVKGTSKEILFSELLKKDDGVLRSLLLDKGMRDIEAAATVDRFVFELRHSTEVVGGEFLMEGFGSLRREQSGRLTFVAITNEIEQIEAEQMEAEQVEPIEPVVVEPVTVEIPTPVQPNSERVDNEETVERSRYSAERIKELYSSPQSFREKDPEIEDLTYSRKQKPLSGYTYVRNGSKKRGVDKVLLFGVIAAFIALGVIAYGYYVGHVEEISDMLVRWGLKSY